MSQVNVLGKFIPYLRSVLEGMGYVEHFDEYDKENVANTIIDKSYSITPRGLTSQKSSHLSFEWTFPVTINLWFSGYRKPSDATDDALEKVEAFLDLALDVSTRYSVSGLTDLFPTSIDFEPISDSNDSIIKASIGVTAIINMFNDKNC